MKTPILLEGNELAQWERLKGVGAVEVRLLSATRVGHDTLTNSPGDWKRVITTLRMATELPNLQVGLRTPLTERVAAEAEAFARLLALLPSVTWRIERADGTPMGLQFERLQHVSTWAENLGVSYALCSDWGELDGPLDVHTTILSPSVLDTIRRGGFWGRQGSRITMPLGSSGFSRFLNSGRALSNIGLELRSLGYPLSNLPECMGGLNSGSSSDEVLYGRGCNRCSRRPSCGGLPSELAMEMTDDADVEPLPLWTGMRPEAKFGMIVGPESERASIFRTLAQYLEGLGCEYTEELNAAEFLMFENANMLCEHLEGEGPVEGKRVLFWDGFDSEHFRRLANLFDPNERRKRGVDWWPNPEWVMLSTDPAQVSVYRSWCLPLRAIHWVRGPIQPQFMGFPLSTGRVYRPEYWPGSEIFRQQAGEADFVVLDRIEGEALNLAFSACLEAGRMMVALSSRRSRWWVRAGVEGVLLRDRQEVGGAVDHLLQNPDKVARITLNARQLARRVSVESFSKVLFEGVKSIDCC